MRAVGDAGPLIHLSWIGKLGLLSQLFDELLIPVAVRDEVLRARPGTPGIRAVTKALEAGSLSVEPVVDSAAVEALRASLDPGEAEAIILMHQTDADIILLDDRRARRLATERGLPVSGTLGILRTARDRDLIPAVLPLVIDLRARGFRISDELVAVIRRKEQSAQ